jgi:integrase
MGKRAKEGASRLTIRNAIAPVRAALAEAVDDGKLAENPAALPRPRGGRSAIPGREPREIVAPSRDLVEKAINGAEGDFRLALQLAASSGLRRGELYGLRWNDFDPETKTVTVKRANIDTSIVAPKTRAGKRTVPVFASVRKAILEHKLASAHSGPDDFVFCDVLGRPLNPSTTVIRDLAATFKRAGLPKLAFRFHDLRHYAGSCLIAERADILLIARIAGHAKPDVTLRVYSHLMTDDVFKAADLFDPLAISASSASASGE